MSTPPTAATGRPIASRATGSSSTTRWSSRPMDEAFVPLHQTVRGLTAAGDIGSEERGLRMSPNRDEIESPIELTTSVGPGGAVEIGGVPPPYRVDTSL